MALKKENLPTSREQLKRLSLKEVKALRKDIRLKIRKVKPGLGCQTPEFAAIKKLNLMLKDEIVDRRIAAEREAARLAEAEANRKAELEARQSADILPFSIPTPDTPDTLLDVFEIEPVAPLRAVGHIIRA